MLDIVLLTAALALGQTGTDPGTEPRWRPSPRPTGSPADTLPASDAGTEPRWRPSPRPALTLDEGPAPRPVLSLEEEPVLLAPLDPLAGARAGAADQPPPPPPAIEITAPLLPPPPAAPAVPKAAAAAPTPDRWAFMRAAQGTWLGLLLDENRTSVYGWTEGSYTLGSQGHITWPILFQSPTDEPLLNQNWLIIERTVVTTGTQPSVGFRFDGVLPGTDARFLQQRGLFNGQPNRAQIDPYQFYGEVYIPTIGRGLDIKVGRVAVPYMAEVSPNVFNPFFSHSYAYYYNPFTHTGVMTTLKLTDNWAIGGWFTLGNDVFFDPAANGMFVGTLQYTAPGGRDNVFVCIGLSTGRFEVDENFSNQDHIDLVWTHLFNSRTRYILDAGFGWENNVPDSGKVTWTWAVNYLGYDITPRLTANTRLEFFDDEQGFKTGFEGLYTAVTAGLTIRPYKSLLIRPELRYDYNNETRPFGDKHGLFTAATDVIVRW